ncbi:MAG: cyclic nucleotide-binding domain-containing protein, partial [Paracoccaceae bacterium]
MELIRGTMVSSVAYIGICPYLSQLYRPGRHRKVSPLECATSTGRRQGHKASRSGGRTGSIRQEAVKPASQNTAQAAVDGQCESARRIITLAAWRLNVAGQQRASPQLRPAARICPTSVTCAQDATTRCRGEPIYVRSREDMPMFRVMPASCAGCAAGKIGFCANLGDQAIELIASISRALRVRKLQVIARGPEARMSALVLRGGMIKVSHTLTDGRQQIVDFLTTGDVLIQHEADGKVAVTVEATTDVDACEVDLADLEG